MLSVNNYPPEYIDRCRARIDTQVAAYRALVASTTERAGATSADVAAAIEAFAPLFFGNLVLALDNYFCHRSRTLEMKDGNPLNEVRMLCTAMMQTNDVLGVDKSIKYDPAKSILGYRIGDEIRLDVEGFVRLADAFFDDVQRKYL